MTAHSTATARANPSLSTPYVLVELPTLATASPPHRRLELMGTVGAVARNESDLLSALFASYGQARAHLLSGPVARVGRDPGNDVVLADASVSSTHAMLSWDSRRGLWVLVDCNSRNGIVANGEAVRGPVTLSSGAHLLIGETYLLLHTEAVYLRTLEVATRSLARS